ncbi:LuxR C-terminal-related transcriptional regulator [Parabacteroides sp. OttesenSCG-928-O15]|nr:LuxR C-terminal-related transcriptional regulator [Parabacteroides sp. OttesenSCG-928-O15]
MPLHNKQIALVLTDTLQRVGLRYVLNEYFPSLSVYSCDCPEALSDAVDYYVTTADIFLIYADFFLPRRNKTLLLIDRCEESAFPGSAPTNHYICKNISQEALIEKLQLFFTAETTVLSQGEGNKDLSARETDVLQLIVKGITNKEIADKLNISLNTVLTHRKNITAKLGIKTVSGLTFYALMNGLVSGDEIEI